MHLGDYVHLATRWGPLAIALALFAAVFTYVGVRAFVPPVFRATATVEVHAGAAASAPGIQPANSVQLAHTEAELAPAEPYVSAAAATASRQAAAGKRDPGTPSGPPPFGVSCSSSDGAALFSCAVTTSNARFAADMANDLVLDVIRSEGAWERTRFRRLIHLLQAREARAEAAISQAQRTLNEPRGKTLSSAQIAALTAQIGTNESRYNSLVQDEAAVRQAAAQQVSMQRIASPALPPNQPNRPQPLPAAALAFVSVLVLLSVAAGVLRRYEDSMVGVEEVRRVTGAPVLGIIPDVDALRGIRPGTASLVFLKNPAAGDAFRGAQAGMAFAGLDKPPRVVLVSSALPQEGRSTVAANLALAFAEEGLTVVLLDLDLRSPSLGNMFGLGGPGLTGLLLDDAPEPDPMNFVLPTHVPGVHVIPAGPLPPNPDAAIRSQRMANVIRRLAAGVDLVILDSPPLLSFEDAALAARLAEGVILVTRPGVAGRRALRQAVDLLHESGAKIIGVIVNAPPFGFVPPGLGARPPGAGAQTVTTNGDATVPVSDQSDEGPGSTVISPS